MLIQDWECLMLIDEPEREGWEVYTEDTCTYCLECNTNNPQCSNRTERLRAEKNRDSREANTVSEITG